MKVLVRAALAGVVALMMFVTVAPAAAAAPEDRKPRKWVQVRENTTFPAGTACADAVHVRNRGAYRVFPAKTGGGQIQEYRNWSYSKFRKKGNTRWVRLAAGGDAHFKPTADGTAITGVGWGASWTGAFKGVYGILWIRGLVTAKANGINTPQWQDDYVSDLDLTKAKHVRQVCYMIGSKPVWGKNVPPSS